MLADRREESLPGTLPYRRTIVDAQIGQLAKHAQPKLIGIRQSIDVRFFGIAVAVAATTLLQIIGDIPLRKEHKTIIFS